MSSEKIPEKDMKPSKKKKPEKKKKSSKSRKSEKKKSHKAVSRAIKNLLAEKKSKNVVGHVDMSAFKNLQPGHTFTSLNSDKRYTVVQTLGEGGMGTVYEVEERDSKQRYAIKTECERKYRKYRLVIEKAVYKLMKNVHFPKYIDAGIEAHYGWIAMQLVGPTLRSKHKLAPERKLSAITCLKIAIQVLDGLEALHQKGYVHRDLKPDNLAIGWGRLSRTVIILDAGIARKYTNEKGEIKRPRRKIRFKGTRSYAPLVMHKRQEYGPKDDFESLLYIMAFFSIGVLPWQNLPKEREGEIIQAKEAAHRNPKLIFLETEASDIFCTIMSYVTGLRYEDEIDYDYMRQLLLRLLNTLGGENLRFDWEDESSTTQMTGAP